MCKSNWELESVFARCGSKCKTLITLEKIEPYIRQGEIKTIQKVFKLGCMYDTLDIVKTLIQDYRNSIDINIGMTLACLHCSFDVIKYFVEDLKLSVNDKYGQFTPLQYSCYNCHFNVCKFLIDSGADVNPEANERSPLQLAKRQDLCGTSYDDVISLLIKSGGK